MGVNDSLRLAKYNAPHTCSVVGTIYSFESDGSELEYQEWEKDKTTRP